ncbi:leucine-rich repeat domain-containing protein [Hungatella hathewayi]|uniref:leucine-rich repeat domain-containing protein n=1 Tax=Hungatella hathewayi TaxID=154046 RepID=UPI00356A9E19
MMNFFGEVVLLDEKDCLKPLSHEGLSNVTIIRIESNVSFISNDLFTELPKSRSMISHKLFSRPLTKSSKSFNILKNIEKCFFSNADIRKLPESIGSLTNLKEIDLSHSNIIELPKSIGLLVNLKELDLLHTNINRLPKSISLLINLETLNLSHTFITELPESIGSLINLKRINLSHTKISRLPESIGNLVNLVELKLPYTYVTELPESIGNLVNLTWLDLSNTRITELPESLGNLVNLLRIDLLHTGITKLPEVIGNFENLLVLDLSHTKITKLPESIGNLVNLVWLNLSNTRIVKLSESIVLLDQLENLNLSNTRINELPESIGNLINLEELNLSHTNITEIPKSIEKLVKLYILDLSYTNITELPETIKSLISLNHLSLNNTNIKILSETIISLNLSYLNISNCSLVSLPKSLLALGIPFQFTVSSFNYGIGIYLYNTKLLEMDIDLFKQPRNYIEQYYKELEKGRILFNEVRVVFLGDGAVGKTTIVEMLKGKPYLENREKSNGIFINNINVQLNDKEETTFHIWDFGGQEIYHSTHEMFLRDNCIYVIVLDGRKEDRPEYWLDFVKRYGKNSPTMLVINKCDDCIKKSNFSLYNLAEKFSDKISCDFEPSYISCKCEYGFEEFKDKLYHLVDKVEGYRKQWPITWLQVKKKLEDMRDKNGMIVNYIDQRTYYQYCDEAGVKELENKNALLEYLCDIGIVFSYHSINKNSVIDEFKVLRPEWITKGIYTIINSNLSKSYNGFVPLNQLENIFTSVNEVDSIITYSPVERNFVISLMEDFKMSYRIGQYEFIPSLAPAERPEYLKDWEYSLSFYFETDGIFPVSLLYQFIVEMLRDVNEYYTWNKGTLLSSNYYNVNVLVQIVDNRFYINMDKKNENACIYLSMIRGVFWKMYQSLATDFDEYVGICHKDHWRYLKLKRLVNMLANGRKADYIDGDDWDCDVDIREVLSYITPHAVMQQIDRELKQLNEERRDNKELKEILLNILNENRRDHQKMLAYSEAIKYDTTKNIQVLENLQKELPNDMSYISKKIDEAIEEIKTGNQKNAYEKVQGIVGDLSSWVSLAPLTPAIIEFIKWIC